MRRRPIVHTVPATTETHSLDPDLFFADRVVAISKYGQRVLNEGGARHAKYVPHAIPVTHWAAVGSRSEQYRAELDLVDRVVILYPGHFGTEYGIKQVLEALLQIRKAVPNIVALLACRPRSRGDLQQRLKLQNMILGAGLAESIRWFETVQDMSTLVGASDLLVMPFQTMRHKVDIPTTLLEGLAAGKPVIVSDIPPMNEIISHQDAAVGCGNVGLLVPPGDAQSLAEAVTRLLTNPEERREMGDRGARFARKEFDIERVAQQYEEIYLEVMA
jgi:glycosyltransferase involved in cell wall biosynthesis